MHNVVFELTMPSNNAWNGKWSGQEQRHFIFKSLSNKKFASLNGENSWYYSFGDGWAANILMIELKPGEKRKLNKLNAGFCGYDWMVNSILMNNKIIV